MDKENKTIEEQMKEMKKAHDGLGCEVCRRCLNNEVCEDVLLAGHYNQAIDDLIPVVEEVKQRGKEEERERVERIIQLCEEMYGRGGCSAIYDTLREMY